MAWDSREQLFLRRFQKGKRQWQIVLMVLRRIRSRCVGYPQSRLQELILFPQSLVFGKQDPAFFKQFIDIHRIFALFAKFHGAHCMLSLRLEAEQSLR